MWRVLRVAAIVFLAVALLNATEGLCLCRDKGPDSPADQTGSHDCCHRRALVVSNAGTSCCQIDKVPHTATPSDVVVVTPPPSALTPIAALDTRIDQPAVMALAYSPSPPVGVLRV